MKVATKLALCGAVLSSVEAFAPASNLCSSKSTALNFFNGGSASKSDLDEEVRFYCTDTKCHDLHCIAVYRLRWLICTWHL